MLKVEPTGQRGRTATVSSRNGRATLLRCCQGDTLFKARYCDQNNALAILLKSTVLHWRRQLWGIGACAPLTSSNLFFMLYFVAIKV